MFCVVGIGQSQSTTPPKLTAEGNQAYCPLSEIPIVTEFNIDNPDNVEISTFYIQISEGYVRNEDILNLTGIHPNIFAEPFNSLEGKLELNWNGSGSSDTDFITAIKAVVFETYSSLSNGEREFSITFGEANYLPSTDHYYEYVSDLGITWSKAEVDAEEREYHGLKGYLATITSPEEAKLSGEQAAGAGWIGGSDAEVEGTWRWVTGPEKGKSFWFGDGNGTTVGADIPFAFWNSSNNEPNNLGGEDYAHVTAPGIGQAGSWNDLSNTGGSSGDYQPKGYIVEYGSPDEPSLEISASTKIYIPEITSKTPAERCGNGVITLKATAAYGDVHWFNSKTVGNLLHTGNSYNPNLSETTVFYIQDSESICSPENRTPITATINPLPSINSPVTLKNCDEDGSPDGYTDFNLTKANSYITNGDTNLIVTYHLTFNEAVTDTNPVNPSPFNNKDAIGNEVFARVENSYNCHNIATVTLEVSTTSFPTDYMYYLESCDDDDTIDGKASFDLTKASSDIIEQFPTGQNLSVHYFWNFTDAQLSENEILPQTEYKNEDPLLQVLYVRVQSEDNGDCFGIGPHLTLTVYPRPEFVIVPEAIVCLNLPPIILEPIYEKDNYSYEWYNENGDAISDQPQVTISKGGIYTAIATSDEGCESFPQSVVVSESINPTIDYNDVTISDNSNNNTIYINNENDNLGIGDYEFALDDHFGPYQDESYFEMVEPGIHTIFVRDKNQCGIASLEVSVLGFPKFFSPNNDGFNDYWNVKGVSRDFYESSLVYIFDRFGKLITQIGRAHV